MSTITAEMGSQISPDGSLDVPPGYKWTEVGVIPEEWDQASVFTLAGRSKSRFDDGDWIEAEFLTESGVRLIQTGNIGVGEFIDKEAKKYISDASFEILGCKEVKTGDLLICRLADPAGRACIVPVLGERKLITSVDVTIFRPVTDVADSHYLLQVFCTKEWFTVVSDRCGGSTRSRIARGQLATIPIPLPPLSEQRAIADALFEVDGLLGTLDELIAKKRAIKQATMQQLLTGKTRLPGFTAEWEKKRIGDISTCLSTANNPRADLRDDGDVEYIHYGDVHAHAKPVFDCRNGSLPRIDRTRIGNASRLEDGDLVMVDASEDLEGVGKSFEVQGVTGRTIVAGLHTILCRGNSAHWAMGFKAYLQFIPAFKSALLRVATGISVYAVSKKQLADVEIALPPVPEQRAIVAVLSDIDAAIAALERRRDKTKHIKQGMMQQLLTGRVRLVKPAEVESTA